MHVVTWTSHNTCYATPTRQVVEVIPVVQARPLTGAVPHVRGLINYRGSLVKLVDAATLMRAETPAFRQYARILIVDTTADAAEPETLGILVDSVIGGEQLDFENASQHATELPAELGFLGPVAIVASRAIQLTDPSQIVTQSASADLK